MGNTGKRNVTLLGILTAAFVLATLLLPAFATSGEYGIESGGSADPTATPNPPTATQAPPTATSVPPTPVPPTTPVATKESCPDGHVWVPNQGACLPNAAIY